MSLRSWPSTSQDVDHSSATISMRSPSPAPMAPTSADFSSAERNLATGDSSSAPFTLIHTSPLAPSFFALSVSASSLLRPDAAASGYSDARTQMPLIDPAPAKALNSVPAKTCVSSVSSRPKRRSGLSTPYRSIASRHVMRSISGGRSPVTASAAATTARPM